MNIKNGLKPIKIDHRDYSFHKTFGAVVNPVAMDAEYDCDAGITMPDQNADGLPYGCTGYTQTELCQDEDVIQFSPSYTYTKTRLMEGTYPQEVGCDIRDSLQSTIDYGVLPSTLPSVPDSVSIDDIAGNNRRGQYFNVQPLATWYDGIRSALWLNRSEKRSISIGTPWYPDWEPAPGSGILPMPIELDPDKAGASWHNWKVCGWVVIGGYTYLKAKSWQGKGYGSNGWAYFSEDVINQVMAQKGCAAFTLSKAQPADVQRIELSVLQLVLSYLRMWATQIGSIFNKK